MAETSPLYTEIAGVLVDEIKTGTYPLGSRLPSETALMRRFACSRNTVRSAMAKVSEIGLISTRRGSGSYVTKPAGIIHSLNSLRSISQVIRDLGFTPGMTKVSLGPAVNPRPDIQAFLGTDSIWRLRRVTTASGTPFSINDSWFSREVGEHLDLKSLIKGGSLYMQITRSIGHPIEEAADYIGADMATPLQAKLLEIAPGEPLLSICRYAHDTSHRPIEVSHSAARGDMYRYFTRLRRTPVGSAGES